MKARRPSHKELTGKLHLARELFAEWIPASPEKLDLQFRRLGLFSDAERGSAIRQALNEIRPIDYAGWRPPEECEEEGFKGCEMFAFAWASRSRERRMYIKFVIKTGKAKGVADTLAVVSFHEEEPR